MAATLKKLEDRIAKATSVLNEHDAQLQNHKEVLSLLASQVDTLREPW